MTEIPEHLLKRAKAAREKTDAAANAADQGSSRIPQNLLDRSKSARTRDADAKDAKDVPSFPVVAVPQSAEVPVGSGPGGHTQRLLTVVKSGSIQDVKSVPVDKVHVWPHLLSVEFVAALACTAFLFMFSWFVNAPLLQAANFNATPNPSKAPWSFMGL
ncbi:MAG: menaquinol-cytochrome c reductase cytochrome b subunit, partial [Actinomycetota bacterium]